MKCWLLMYPTVVTSYQSTHGTAPPQDIFPVVLGEVYFFFPAKDRGCWEWNSRVSVLHSPHTTSVVAVICLSFSAVVRDFCNISLARRGERAGAACEANLLKFWLLIAPVQMQGSIPLQFSDPPGCLHRAKTQLGSGTPSNVSLWVQL